MKLKINRPIVGSSDVSEFNSAIMRTLENMTGLIPGLNECKWRCIVEEWKGNELLWLLDISPTAGNGSECAEEKMATLHHYQDIANTGELRDHGLSDQENLDMLLTKTGLRLVHWYGGIRLKLTDFTPSASSDSKMETDSTEILVAFSGARQDADAFIAIAVLLTINKVFAKIHPEIYTNYVFGPLEADPVTGFALNILDN